MAARSPITWRTGGEGRHVTDGLDRFGPKREPFVAKRSNSVTQRVDTFVSIVPRRQFATAANITSWTIDLNELQCDNLGCQQLCCCSVMISSIYYIIVYYYLVTIWPHLAYLLGPSSWGLVTCSFYSKRERPAEGLEMSRSINMDTNELDLKTTSP